MQMGINHDDIVEETLDHGNNCLLRNTLARAETFVLPHVREVGCNQSDRFRPQTLRSMCNKACLYDLIRNIAVERLHDEHLATLNGFRKRQKHLAVRKMFDLHTLEGCLCSLRY